MKYLYIAISLLLPQAILAQYDADCFTADGKGTEIPLRMNVMKDTIVSLDINDTVYGFFLSGSSSLNDKTGYVMVTLTDDHGAKITVLPGGTVNIDGGSVISAKMNLATGSRLNILNDGVVIPPANGIFLAPSGSRMRITEGTIQ